MSSHGPGLQANPQSVSLLKRDEWLQVQAERLAVLPERTAAYVRQTLSTFGVGEAQRILEWQAGSHLGIWADVLCRTNMPPR